jgi:hypothetical protein
VSIALLRHGSPLPGFSHDDCEPIVGNRLAAPVSFQAQRAVNGSNLGPLASQSLQLEFRIRPPARLFAWSFTCTNQI